ncbi:MAG: CHAD domain-containing protein [Armatimonadetes bacterium]|nr:CHAD domain-containing protein [Armatimonadota bacterium]
MPFTLLPETIERLCARYRNDNAHTSYVTDLAVRLFRVAGEIHGLPEDTLPLLRIAGQLHDLGTADDPDNHHLRSQAIIVSEKLGDIPAETTHMIAAVAACHREDVESKDPRLAGLGRADRKTVLRLAAILRVADGLDYTHTQSVKPSAMVSVGKEAHLYIVGSGPEIEACVERANLKADLWQKIMPYPLQIHFRPASASRLVCAEDSMVSAGKVTMSFHFNRILRHEPGTRAGEDIEALHDMRVATRRLRAAFRVFSRTFKKEAVGGLLEDVRWLGGGLGTVRDLDVLLEFLEGYRREAPQEDMPGLDALIADRRAERGSRRMEMLALLDSERYEQFKADFQDFLMNPDPGLRPGANRRRVREEAPKALRQRLKDVLDFDERLPDAPPEVLHALRIEGKRLRYTCEFFQGTYDRRLDDLIKRTTEMQGLLGNIHDADVTVEFLKQYQENLFPDTSEADRRAIKRLEEFLSDRRSEDTKAFYVHWADFSSAATRKKVQRTITHSG